MGYKMKGYSYPGESPLKQKKSKLPDPKDPKANIKYKEFLEMRIKDVRESIEKEGKYTYDKDTKSWISSKTGKPASWKKLYDPKTGERLTKKEK